MPHRFSRFCVLTVLCLLPVSISFAQTETIVYGVVTDAETGKPLAFVTIHVEGTYQASITNVNGRYEIRVEHVPAVLRISHIGYASQKIQMDEGAPGEYNIRLEPVTYELEEIVVTAEDLGPNIMRKVIEKKQAWQKAMQGFRVEAYTRLTLENDTGIVAIMESLSDAFWDREKGWREVLKSKRETSNMDLDFGEAVPAAAAVTNLYDDNIDVGGHNLMGVTHPDAVAHYRFRLVGRRYLDDQLIYDISVIPKNKLVSAFEGQVSVLDSAYAMVEASLKPNQAFLFPPPIRGLSVNFKQQFSDFGKAFWLPVGLQFEAELDIGILGLYFPMIKMSQLSRLSGYEVNAVRPDSLYAKRRVLTVDSVAVRQDSLLNRRGVVVPLSEVEQTAYVRIDSTMTLEQAFEPRGFLARFVKEDEEEREERRRRRRERRNRREGQQGQQDQNAKEPVHLNPLKNLKPQVWYNRVDGAHLGVRKTLQANWLELSGVGAYNTGIKRWSINGVAKFSWGERQRGFLELDYLRGSEKRYPSHLFSRWHTSTLSLFGKEDYFDFFWNKRLNTKVGYWFRTLDTTVSAGVNVERHRSLAETTHYTLFGNDFVQRVNPAIDPGRLRSVVFRVRTNKTEEEEPVFVGRKQVDVMVEHSRPGLFSSDFSFTRYHFLFNP
ncbi:MAG: DUF5686 family protein, partial [bacterium]|nr:DUF5686 family protein [bacterium]